MSLGVEVVVENMTVLKCRYSSPNHNWDKVVSVDVDKLLSLYCGGNGIPVNATWEDAVRFSKSMFKHDPTLTEAEYNADLEWLKVNFCNI